MPTKFCTAPLHGKPAACWQLSSGIPAANWLDSITKSIRILHRKLVILYRNSSSELVAFPRIADGKLAAFPQLSSSFPTAFWRHSGGIPAANRPNSITKSIRILYRELTLLPITSSSKLTVFYRVF